MVWNQGYISMPYGAKATYSPLCCKADLTLAINSFA